MKVVVVNFDFSEYTACLVNGLSKTANVILLQPQDIYESNASFLSPDIQICKFRRQRIRDPRNLFLTNKIFKIIQNLQPDIVHVQQTNNFWFDLSLLLKKLPLVTTIHDVFRHPGDRDLAFGAEYTRQIAFYQSRQLIVHSHDIKYTLSQSFNIPAEIINVLPHGELGSLYKFHSKDLDKPKERDHLLFFGRIWAYKGLKYLIQAIDIVAQSIPTVKLTIAGRGEIIDDYFPNGIDPTRYEVISGFMPNSDVARLFKKSTAVILPYIESSQSGVAAIAYGLGTPVIASDIAGLREMINHERDGLLVPPKDVHALANAIIRLLSDSNLQSTFEHSAIERSKTDLHWDHIANLTISVYKKVIAQEYVC